jgi:pentatricopeptide repeat protein
LPLLHQSIKGILPHLGTQEISRVLLRCQSESSKALNFFVWIKFDLNLEPSPHNYCLIIHILAWSGKYKVAMKLLSEFIELSVCDDVFRDLKLCRDECSWNPVIFDMLVKAYVKLNLVLEGFTAFKKMTNLGFEPNVVTVNCLLNGLLKLNETEKCWEIFEEMEVVVVRPNLYTLKRVLILILLRIIR